MASESCRSEPESSTRHVTSDLGVFILMQQKVGGGVLDSPVDAWPEPASELMTMGVTVSTFRSHRCTWWLSVTVEVVISTGPPRTVTYSGGTTHAPLVR